MRKAERHDAIRERARAALRNLYHNATPHHPHDLGEFAENYDAWFADAAEQEIDYILDGGASPGDYRETLEHPANAGKFKSEAARRYYVRKGMRDRDRERARCNRLDSRTDQTNAEWERIGEFGELHQYGRGGRTLAPEKLIRTRGGSSFGIAESYADDLPIADVVDLIRIVESFNRHVRAWCSRENLAFMWKEYTDEFTD